MCFQLTIPVPLIGCKILKEFLIKKFPLIIGGKLIDSTLYDIVFLFHGTEILTFNLFIKLHNSFLLCILINCYAAIKMSISS